jgi:hypothetical protein
MTFKDEVNEKCYIVKNKPTKITKIPPIFLI